VIHTVGPVWQGGGANERALLASCYRRSLELAREHGLASIAFPAISTGVYRFPARQAADIALRTIADVLSAHALPERVILCMYDDDANSLMTEALAGVS
jgi:O-acetyl-ADP-ribose deacetylase (regulator of RNase III)